MAYMNQAKKTRIAANVKPILKKYGVKGSLSVRNHMSIVLTITEGKIDFNKDYGADAKFGIQVNPYWYQEHFTGRAKEFLSEVIPAMYSADYYDHSDAQIDYFSCAYYIDVNIGKWNKQYKVI
jgi:hypothetical protein